MLELVEMSEEQVAEWLPVIKAHYVDERVAAGQDRGVATATSDQQFGMLIPDGHPIDGQHVMNALLDGEKVGMLWMGRPFDADPDTWFVFNVEVEESRRGQGLGREIMLMAESWTREHGGKKIVLNVFGPNVVARSLYDALGYTVMATNMLKEV
jgi:ribosomal protein S18 acetylase RimI-like enzyme